MRLVKVVYATEPESSSKVLVTIEVGYSELPSDVNRVTDRQFAYRLRLLVGRAMATFE